MLISHSRTFGRRSRGSPCAPPPLVGCPPKQQIGVFGQFLPDTIPHDGVVVRNHYRDSPGPDGVRHPAPPPAAAHWRPAGSPRPGRTRSADSRAPTPAAPAGRPARSGLARAGSPDAAADGSHGRRRGSSTGPPLGGVSGGNPPDVKEGF